MSLKAKLILNCVIKNFLLKTIISKLYDLTILNEKNLCLLGCSAEYIYEKAKNLPYEYLV